MRTGRLRWRRAVLRLEGQMVRIQPRFPLGDELSCQPLRRWSGLALKLPAAELDGCFISRLARIDKAITDLVQELSRQRISITETMADTEDSPDRPRYCCAWVGHKLSFPLYIYEKYILGYIRP
jgi:hypothetical protein